MDVLHILTTIKDDWAILAFFFALGGAWWQGKTWFKKVNLTLDKVKETTATNTDQLKDLHSKVDQLSDKVTNLEHSLEDIKEEQHNQDVKLAVLETTNTRTAISRG